MHAQYVTAAVTYNCTQNNFFTDALEFSIINVTVNGETLATEDVILVVNA